MRSGCRLPVAIGMVRLLGRMRLRDLPHRHRPATHHHESPQPPDQTSRLRQLVPFGVASAVGAVMSAAVARMNQPNMQNDLFSPYAAQSSPQAAARSSNGGHRDIALNLVAQAIEQETHC